MTFSIGTHTNDRTNGQTHILSQILNRCSGLKEAFRIHIPYGTLEPELASKNYVK